MKNRALLAGVGKMGRFHAKTVMSDDLPMIDLVAVCDANVNNLIAFRQENPEIPVFLTPKDCNPSDDDLCKALDNGIEVYYSIADLVNDMGSNTLINATQNGSHLPVLRAALSAKDSAGKSLIATVFQEKPFADIGEDMDDIKHLIQENNVVFNLNGILTFSPLWGAFNNLIAAAEKEGFEVTHVYCAYGKDRTQDTRQAPGGWNGMCGIHALDISTGAGLRNLIIDVKDISNQRGVLAEVAGDVPYQTNLTAQMTNRQGNPVSLRLEGSFAWSPDVRRSHVQYQLTNKNGDEMLIQLDFEQTENGKHADFLHHVVKDNKGKVIVPVMKKTSNADKLQGYYRSVLDKDDKRQLYDLERAMSVQRTLNVIGSVPSKITMPPHMAPDGPKYIDDIALLMRERDIKKPKPMVNTTTP